MVVAKDIKALELEYTAHAVSLDSGAQVTNMHVFSDVGRGEINDDTLFFLSCSLGFVHRNGAFNVGNLVDEVFDVRVLQLDVEEESRLGGVALTHLGKLYRVDSVIVSLVDALNKFLSHIFAAGKAVRASLLVHIEVFHSGGASEISSRLLLDRDLHSFGSSRAGLVSSTLHNPLELFSDGNHILGL